MPTSPNTTSEHDLVIQVQRGDRLALGELYDRYKSSVYSYCLRLLTDRQIAEDSTHETFLKMFNEIRSIRSPESFRPWLFRIARNEVFMRIRKSRRNGIVDDEAVWDSDTPHERFVTNETSEIVRRLLQELKQEYREVLVLREYEQMTYAEIADLTGTTESSVKSRIFKARKALAARLKPFFQQERPL
ncbi:MAG: hypothetical protein HW374_1527 [Bacteroidetes bacterium]|nr:hypothetical protein [Bacteroidota bacterium]